MDVVVIVPSPHLLYTMMYQPHRCRKVRSPYLSLLVSSVNVCSKSLSFKVGGLVCDLLRRCRQGLRPNAHCQKSISFYNRDVHCLEDTGLSCAFSRRNVVYWNPNGRSSMISCAISPLKDTLRECLFSWYAFCVLTTSRTLTYSIYVTIIYMGMIFLILVSRTYISCVTQNL